LADASREGQDLAIRRTKIMLYRIVGEEITTHRRVEIPNWEAADTATAKRLAREIGVVVSRIEPMSGTTQEDKHDRRWTTFKTLSMATPQAAKPAVETNTCENDAETQYGDRLHTISVVCTFVSLVLFALLALVLIVNGAPGLLIVIGLLLGGGAIYAIRGIVYQVITCHERAAIEAEAKAKKARQRRKRWQVVLFPLSAVRIRSHPTNDGEKGNLWR
jgi:hypothetical protein